MFKHDRITFLTKKISQFLFLVVEDILVLYPSHKTRKINTIFPRKNLFISLHHFSNFTLINKTTILLHKYLKINLCFIHTILLANDLTMFDPFFHLPVNICLLRVNNRVLSLVSN